MSILRKVVCSLALLMMVGCDVVLPGWISAAETHTCTEEQHKRVETEARWCKENSGYVSPYCYSTAIMRNCQPEDKK